MTAKLPAPGKSRKYAADGKVITDEIPPAYIPCTPAPEKPSFLAHISKPIGRKALCFELRISKHQLDMWISGERKDPIERTRDIMRIAAKRYPDMPLHIAQDLVDEFGGVVTLALIKKGE
jgi:hypothetical protein